MPDVQQIVRHIICGHEAWQGLHKTFVKSIDTFRAGNSVYTLAIIMLPNSYFSWNDA